MLFQSTHPVWGETMAVTEANIVTKDFNPLTPCGVRRYIANEQLWRDLISIHSPRVG